MVKRHKCIANAAGYNVLAMPIHPCGVTEALVSPNDQDLVQFQAGMFLISNGN